MTEVTVLLHRWRSGDAAAADSLIESVYPQLRSMAARYMHSGNQTLNATSLVHEAYLKMLGADAPFQDRVHFFALSARIMRQIIVDHARTGARQKRGGSADKLNIDDAVVISPEPSRQVIELDEALKRLAEFDPRKAEVIELTYFGGLTQPEVAAALGISEPTVQRDLKLAKAWLYRELAANPFSAGSTS